MCLTVVFGQCLNRQSSIEAGGLYIWPWPGRQASRDFQVHVQCLSAHVMLCRGARQMTVLFLFRIARRQSCVEDCNWSFTCSAMVSYLLLDVQEAFIASAMHTSNYPGGAQLSAVHRTAVAAHPSDIYFRSHRAASNRHPCPLTNTDKQDESQTDVCSRLIDAVCIHPDWESTCQE